MVDIKVIYEMNPPKVLYNNYFDSKNINKNIDLFLSRTKRISEFVDGVHITDNVLGIPRVSSLIIVSMLKKMGISKPISCTCRLYDKNLISVLQFVTDSIIAGVYSILILRGDEPIVGNKIID
ncbi:MAG TPA: methylenetetrahydrofolate reductase, partial [Nitrososphaeraceae archaeon]|nr:methylenetetrahydrofolate reductase [Nitrososphaeraceae archaeon]